MRKWNLLLISIWKYFFYGRNQANFWKFSPQKVFIEVRNPVFETNKLNVAIFKWYIIGPVWSWPKKWKLNNFLEFNRLESGVIFSPQFVLCRMSAAGAHPLWAQIIGDASLFHIVTIHRVSTWRKATVAGERSTQQSLSGSVCNHQHSTSWLSVYRLWIMY
jgi:hypothetical protein